MLLLSFHVLALLSFVTAQAYKSHNSFGIDPIASEDFDSDALLRINERIDQTKCQTSEYNCCFVTDTEQCDFSYMEKGKATLVFPGGRNQIKPRCIESNKGSYAFQVVPGDLDRVLFFLQGGGACLTDGSDSCKNATEYMSWSNFANKRTSDGPFQGYTIITVLYCSGDFHLGDVQKLEKDYSDSVGVPIQQRGLRNFRSVLYWTKIQQERRQIGSLDETLSNLLVLGNSAGAVGAQCLSDEILSLLTYNRAAVILDSFVGDDLGGSTFTDLNFCSKGGFDATLTAMCNSGRATVAEVFLNQAAKHPDVVYAFIDSKTDSVQISEEEQPAELYNRMNRAFELYLKHLNNVIFYLINGENHVYTTQPAILKTSDPLGLSNNGRNFNGLMLQDWIGSLPLQAGKRLSSECEGEARTSPRSTGSFSDTTYCFRAVRDSATTA